MHNVMPTSLNNSQTDPKSNSQMIKSMNKFHVMMIAIITAIISCAAFIITSCSSDEKLEPISPTDAIGKEYTELITSLKNYSSHYIPSQKSRGDLGFGKFKESIKADYSGHTEDGSTSLSISKSRKKWKDLHRDENIEAIEESLTAPKRTLIQNLIDSLKNEYTLNPNNAGALHNASILQSLLFNNLNVKTTLELVQSVFKSFDALGIENTNMSEEEAVNKIDNFFENIYDDDISVIYNRLGTIHPERKGEFKVLTSYFTNIQTMSNIEDIANYTEGYTSIINSSTISVNEQKKINANISIALASLKLWTFIDSLPKKAVEN